MPAWTLLVLTSSYHAITAPSKLALIYIILAALYFVAAAIELFGIVAAWKSSIRFARTYFWGSAVVALIVTGAELVRTIVHFTDKSAIIDACKQSYSSDISSGSLSSTDVASYCQDSWNNMTYVRRPFFRCRCTAHADNVFLSRLCSSTSLF